MNIYGNWRTPLCLELTPQHEKERCPVRDTIRGGQVDSSLNNFGPGSDDILVLGEVSVLAHQDDNIAFYCGRLVRTRPLYRYSLPG